MENELFPKKKNQFRFSHIFIFKKRNKKSRIYIRWIDKNEDKEKNNLIIEIFDPINIDSHE